MNKSCTNFLENKGKCCFLQDRQTDRQTDEKYKEKFEKSLNFVNKKKKQFV